MLCRNKYFVFLLLVKAVNIIPTDKINVAFKVCVPIQEKFKINS